jgi:hypothetical protein
MPKSESHSLSSDIIRNTKIMAHQEQGFWSGFTDKTADPVLIWQLFHTFNKKRD